MKVDAGNQSLYVPYRNKVAYWCPIRENVPIFHLAIGSPSTTVLHPVLVPEIFSDLYVEKGRSDYEYYANWQKDKQRVAQMCGPRRVEDIHCIVVLILLVEAAIGKSS